MLYFEKFIKNESLRSGNEKQGKSEASKKRSIVGNLEKYAPYV